MLRGLCRRPCRVPANRDSIIFVVTLKKELVPTLLAVSRLSAMSEEPGILAPELTLSSGFRDPVGGVSRRTHPERLRSPCTQRRLHTGSSPAT